MTTATIAVAEGDIRRWARNCETIVSVENDIVLEQYVGCCHVETYKTDQWEIPCHGSFNRLTVAVENL